ncbi:amino acid permease [Candidatus Mycobacterium methanotrophicum]|uniref:Amino acid permease n=1 Tax=Candidatus Mycobacterium methanotrophicum TaxID=2943498 RepID=A0ABY4QQ66_9MYCO|nr:amino acid permease [Candidatus Mycobacterium methanotrophicum]UQX12021.1 amino acid permease [Candidatus Mycobacterium methanotrophicum]
MLQAHGAHQSSPSRLHRGLSQRQLNMIALGGVIGAGLFVGSGVIIGETGPGAFITYAVCGIFVILVMRMLGEMATADPSTGSFADYARQALGGWAGFSVGWLYWYFWVVVVGFEAIAGGAVLSYWIRAPLWLLSLILMVGMTATNLFSVATFGEFEFWFAGIKVAAIVVFLGLGSLFVLGAWPRHGIDFSNLTAYGGFFPHGIGAIFSAVPVVIPAMVGAEVATIAAAETADPERAVARATRSVVVRIVIFYLGSVFLLAVIVPWNSHQAGASPYVAALGQMGIPAAGHIMNAVVLTAVLSCLNSGLYTASRMLFVLAARNEAPMELVKVGRRGVPYIAILCSSMVGFLCVVMAWAAPGAVFVFLLKSSGSLVLSVYLLIALAQIVLRRRTPEKRLRVKMWFFPGLSVLTLAGIVGVLVLMALDARARTELWLGVVSWTVILALYFVPKWWRGSPKPEPAAAPMAGRATRVLVLANKNVSTSELFDVVQRIDAQQRAEYFICVPVNPVDTGQAERTGPVFVLDATVAAAQQRLDAILTAIGNIGLSAAGDLGDYRPLRALAAAVQSFQPDHLVIAEARSSWLRLGLVDKARAAYPIPVTHVLSGQRAADLAAAPLSAT